MRPFRYSAKSSEKIQNIVLCNAHIKNSDQTYTRNKGTPSRAIHLKWQNKRYYMTSVFLNFKSI